MNVNNSYIDELFNQIREEFINDEKITEIELNKIKEYISIWFLKMYEENPKVLKEMSNSDDLLKMIKREFRFSKLLD